MSENMSTRSDFTAIEAILAAMEWECQNDNDTCDEESERCPNCIGWGALMDKRIEECRSGFEEIKRAFERCQNVLKED